MIGVATPLKQIKRQRSDALCSIERCVVRVVLDLQVHAHAATEVQHVRQQRDVLWQLDAVSACSACSACSARTCERRERVDPIGIAFIAVPMYKHAPLCAPQPMMLS